MVTDTIRVAIGAVQCHGNRSGCGRIHTVARPLQLYAFEAARRLVHLKETDDRCTTHCLAVQHEIEEAVAEIETLREPYCRPAELAEELVGALAPVGVRH